MNMKVVQKVLLILIVAMCMAVVMPKNVVRAADTPIGAIEQIDKTKVSADSGAVDSLATVVKRILSFLQIASGLIAVVMIAWTGFRYIIETPQMKDELKKTMIPIVVGVLLVFFATSIAKFIIGLFK